VTGRRGRRTGFVPRHFHTDRCEVIPPEDRATRFSGIGTPAMAIRTTAQQYTNALTAGNPAYFVEPWLFIIKGPVKSRDVGLITTWPEWNSVAEAVNVDAEIEHNPTSGDYPHVRARPGRGARIRANRTAIKLIRRMYPWARPYRRAKRGSRRRKRRNAPPRVAMDWVQ
jgi:hypothetical protein